MRHRCTQLAGAYISSLSISLAIVLSQILYSVWKCVREVSELKYKQRIWENFGIAWNFLVLIEIF